MIVGPYPPPALVSWEIGFQQHAGKLLGAFVSCCMCVISAALHFITYYKFEDSAWLSSIFHGNSFLTTPQRVISMNQ